MVSLVVTTIMTLLSGEGKSSAQTALTLCFWCSKLLLYFPGFCGNKDGPQGLVHARQALHHRAAPLPTTLSLYCPLYCHRSIVIPSLKTKTSLGLTKGWSQVSIFSDPPLPLFLLKCESRQFLIGGKSWCFLFFRQIHILLCCFFLVFCLTHLMFSLLHFRCITGNLSLGLVGPCLCKTVG